MRSLIAGLLALCACSPHTVNTVQPGAIEKTALDGEWFWRRTVADVPYGTAATFAGASDPDGAHPLARRRRPPPGLPQLPQRRRRGHQRASKPTASTGLPCMVFRIEKHFDIRRGYNRTTGEESNVIEENTERPWYEREHFRVDWSNNIADVAFSFAGLDATVLGWSTGDDRSRTAHPQFDDSDADGTIDSLMLEQQVLLAAEHHVLARLRRHSGVPVLRPGPPRVRGHRGQRGAVVRAGRERAPFAGLAYDDRYMETFGYFSTQRLAYDRAYGLVEPNRTRWANRHPLFEASYQTDDEDGDLCKVQGPRRGALRHVHAADQEPEPVEIPVARARGAAHRLPRRPRLPRGPAARHAARSQTSGTGRWPIRDQRPSVLGLHRGGVAAFETAASRSSPRPAGLRVLPQQPVAAQRSRGLQHRPHRSRGRARRNSRPRAGGRSALPPGPRVRRGPDLEPVRVRTECCGSGRLHQFRSPTDAPAPGRGRDRVGYGVRLRLRARPRRHTRWPTSSS